MVQEAKLLEYLSVAGIPTTRFYKTLNNEFVFNYQNHIICLEEYVEGQAYDYDDLPLELLPQVGKMLGRLHQALKDYPLPIDMSDKWLSSFSAENMIAQYDALIKIAESKADDKNTNQIIDDLQYKKQLAIRCEEYKNIITASLIVLRTVITKVVSSFLRRMKSKPLLIFLLLLVCPLLGRSCALSFNPQIIVEPMQQSMLRLSVNM